MQVKIIKLENGNDLPLPSYATEHSAGMDLYAAIDEKVIIKAGEKQIIPTGIAIELPDGFEAQIRPRSGLAAKSAITVLNSPGTIDADYRGEVKVILINLGHDDVVIERGMRIAQMIIAKYQKISWQEASELGDTIRADKGFGSTGTR